MSEEKPFPASRRKLREARKQGQVQRAPLASFAIQLILFIIVLYFGLGRIWLQFQILLEYSLVWGFRNLALCLKENAEFILELVFPALGVSSLACFFTELYQVGPGWFPGAGGGIGVVNGTRKVVKGFCSAHVIALRTVSILALSLYCMSKTFNQALFAPELWEGKQSPSVETLRLFQLLITKVWIPVCAFAIFLGAVEYVVKRRKYRAELSMSFDELRQELKEEEGDPQIRAARRQLHQALAYEELVARVRTSKVLIVERA